MIKTIAHVCIHSSNLQKSLEFYTGALGLKKKFNFIRKGELFGFYIEVDPTHFIEVFKTEEAPGPHPRITHLCLETDQMDALREKLIAAGVKVTDKILGADHSYQFWTHDPDGVAIEFHQYTEKSCQFTNEDCMVNWC